VIPGGLEIEETQEGKCFGIINRIINQLKRSPDEVSMSSSLKFMYKSVLNGRI
jgi:hypothetical protein